MLSAIFQILIYFILLFVCTTYFLFWLDSHSNKDTKKIQISIPRPETNAYLKPIVFEILAILIHILFLPLANLKLKPKLEKGKNTYPILLLPGFLENQTDWWFHRANLHRVGFTQIYTLNLYPIFGSIEEHAKLVHQQIQDIIQETIQSKVILIGHSRGGLVASYCNEYLANNIAMVITLATPFFGSKLAKYVYGKYTKQMLPDSEFLVKLTQSIKSSLTPYKCIAATMDSLVFPMQACFPILDKRELLTTSVIDGIGHIWLIRSSKINSQLYSWLQNPN